MQQDLTGQVFSSYQLVRLIGEGGMGSVYEAVEESIGRRVALKILPRALAQTPGYAERFTREVKVAATLEHIHIVPIYAHGTHEGMNYVVMRLMVGGDLQKRLRKLGRPTPGDAKKLLIQIGDALDYAHSRGVVHRDLKASNVMFDERGNAYLADFGIAKVVGDISLTGTGQILGTPVYMAPEQWTGDPVDTRADIYAFAVLGYQLLTGQLPFVGETAHVIMFKHFNETPRPPTALQPTLAPQVDDVLLKGMAKNPDERYASAGEFSQALIEALSQLAEADDQTSGFTTAKVETEDNLPHVETVVETFRPDTDATPVEETFAIEEEALPNRRWLGVVAAGLLVLLMGAGFFMLRDGEQANKVAAISTATKELVASSTPQATLPPPMVLVQAPTLLRAIPHLSVHGITVDSGSYPIVGIDALQTFYEVQYQDELRWIYILGGGIEVSGEVSEALIVAGGEPVAVGQGGNWLLQFATDDLLGKALPAQGQFPLLALSEKGNYFLVEYENTLYWLSIAAYKLRLEGDIARLPRITPCLLQADRGINVRGGPSTAFDIVSGIAQNQRVEAYVQTLGVDEEFWYWLGENKWVRSDVVTALTAACDNLLEIEGLSD